MTRLHDLKCGGILVCFILLVILALSDGCQIDYPMSQDFPNESAPSEVEA